MYSLAEEFTGKVIIVTGGNKGIGKGCAEAFCDVGANVVICGRNEADGLAVSQEITAKGGGECVFFPCNVNHEEQVKALVDFTVEKYKEEEEGNNPKRRCRASAFI